MSVVAVAFASAVVTGDFGDIQDEFDVGEVVVVRVSWRSSGVQRNL